jgi:hypothetical protein
MEKLKELRSDVLTIRFNRKRHHIDITEELQIKEVLINKQLIEIPSNYDFLCRLRDEAIKKRNQVERRKNSVYSEVWLYYKESGITNEASTHKTMMNKKYQSYDEKFLKADFKAQRLISICRAYESREQIIRTLSANNRKII